MTDNLLTYRQRDTVRVKVRQIFSQAQHQSRDCNLYSLFSILLIMGSAASTSTSTHTHTDAAPSTDTGTGTEAGEAQKRKASTDDISWSKFESLPDKATAEQVSELVGVSI